MRTITSCVLATLAASVLAGAAAAQSTSLRDQLFGAPPDGRAVVIPPIARFVPDDGAAFVLDRSVPRQVLMRFESSVEIWALTPTAGPRGDIIYKDDVGETVLRATRLGGLTLFTPDRPGGVAVAMSGSGTVLRPPAIQTPTQLLQSFAQASERSARSAGHPVVFEIENQPFSAASLLADAASVTAEAFAVVSRRGERGKRLLVPYSKVQFVLGPSPEAVASGATLRIIITPDRGMAGRPSSRRIEQALKP